jgi:hypothetical protein
LTTKFERDAADGEGNASEPKRLDSDLQGVSIMAQLPYESVPLRQIDEGLPANASFARKESLACHPRQRIAFDEIKIYSVISAWN